MWRESGVGAFQAVRPFVVAAALATTVSCEPTGYRASFVKPTDVASLDAGAPFLKCHMREGSVFVLSNWRFDGPLVRGTGRRYDLHRKLVSEGELVVALDAVAIFETNRPETVPRSPAGYIVMGVVTVASVGLTAVCVANPKSCFGSCPTFYAPAEGGGDALEAEGFSASIARPLEDTDVDAMWTAQPRGKTFDVVMANEALETHLVDSVRLLAAPRPPGMRVYRAGDAYFAAPEATRPSSCRAPSGDCLDDVAAIDTRAYQSPADAEDLSSQETLELSFPRPSPGASLGVVIAARNSLLNTFIFYQALAYLGREAGSWYARGEVGGVPATGPEVDALRRFGRLLGGIDVAVEQEGGQWKSWGEHIEVGPIAREVQLIPIEAPSGAADVHVRLTMTRGNWKLDHVGLARLAGKVDPIVLAPFDVLHAGRSDALARDRLAPGGDRLVTYPGDAYTLRFDLPAGEHELFLESRGYYIEWMRTSWLADESPVEVLRILADPQGAMRKLAPRYKSVEGDMERLFWNSRMQVQR
jgi:hypothetical protein